MRSRSLCDEAAGNERVVDGFNAVIDASGTFGNGNNMGKCYWETTATVSCSEGWNTDKYDFYELLRIKGVAVVPLPTT